MTRTLSHAAILGIAVLAGPAALPAQAAGCVKGAIVGGVAGHFVHHHGLIGAGIGCIIGHHEAKKHAAELRRQQVRSNSY